MRYWRKYSGDFSPGMSVAVASSCHWDLSHVGSARSSLARPLIRAYRQPGMHSEGKSLGASVIRFRPDRRSVVCSARRPFGHRAALAVIASAAATVALCGLATPAWAAPTANGPVTTVRYSAGATATAYAGAAFDTCTAPPLSTISAWSASPYRAIGVYIGGVNRTCSQPQLTATWVTAVSTRGWRLLPIYKGLQAPCGGKPTDQKIIPANAASEGTAAADDAVAKGKALGILGGSALYNDLETYATGNATCRTAVLRYLSGWTTEIHRLGYVAGVYAQLASGARDLASVYASTSYARPDVLWIARYDGSASLAGWAGVPNADWATHQRAKQYRNSHDEIYGGVTLSVDNDQVDAPVATVGYAYKVISSTALNARSGPSTSYPVVKAHAPGSALAVACQTPGQKIGSTSVWDKLTDGSYVTDYYASTPSKSGYSAPLSRCSYPYQVTATALNERTGPGASYPVKGTLAAGALAWLTCQRAGSMVGTTRIWDKLTNGRWVTDFYVATPSKTTYSKPAPRC